MYEVKHFIDGNQVAGESDRTGDLFRPATGELEGKVRFSRPEWTPDRYNLEGFGLDPVNPPSFEEFFGPAGSTHPR